ncbi:MAG: primosomal protein N' (replication factor Y) - superfamily II helicase [Pseudomonadota bacterium]
MNAPRDFPCNTCGARLAFRPGVAALVCPYCGARNEIGQSTVGPDAPPPSPWGAPGEAPPAPPAAPAWPGDGVVVEEDADAAAQGALIERDLAEALAALESAGSADGTIETTRTTRCPGCGAEVDLGDDRIADDCPFCATPLAREATHDHRHPAPQGVLPFALEQREAREAMKKWLSGLWFAPNGLKKFAEAGRPLDGVYVPHYTFDAYGQAQYRGQRGDAYYVTRTVTRNGKTMNQRVRRIRWTSVSGRVANHYDDVLVPATATLTEFGKQAAVRSPEWDLQGMQAYNTGFLAGFTAEAPSLPLGEGFEQAADAMEASLRQIARRDIGGDEQRISWFSARFSEASFKHVLLPVWLASYRYRNEPYRVAINARTGKVVGQRPYSWWKIAIAVVLALAVVGGFLYLNAAQL